MNTKEHAATAADAIKAALETYRRGKLALQRVEQTETCAKENGGTITDEPTLAIDEQRASVKRQQRELIQLQNDQFRITLTGGEVYMTSGVQGRGGLFFQACLDAVRTFAEFDADNDPYGEHDFGVLQIEGQKVYWKIDAYDRERCYGSEDSADPELTTRILTLLLPEEY